MHTFSSKPINWKTKSQSDCCGGVKNQIDPPDMIGTSVLKRTAFCVKRGYLRGVGAAKANLTITGSWDNVYFDTLWSVVYNGVKIS